MNRVLIISLCILFHPIHAKKNHKYLKQLAPNLEIKTKAWGDYMKGHMQDRLCSEKGVLRRCFKITKGVCRLEISKQLNKCIKPITKVKKITPHDPKGLQFCLLYTSPSPRDRQKSRMPSSA